MMVSTQPSYSTPYWRTSALAVAFRSIEEKDPPGLYPFDADVFHEATRAWSHGEKLAADFVLSVFNPDWKFDLHEAMAVWDQEHRKVFLEWAAAPWWE